MGTLHTRIADGTVIDVREYKWDPMYNKTRREDVRDGGPRLRHAYAYDAIYRLGETVVTDETMPGDPMVLSTRKYDLDGVGNRESVAGCSAPGLYSMNPHWCETAATRS